MLEIDGSEGEGGGAILRTALGLSTLTQTPFRIVNIRKGRPQPGLKHEHLHCIRILQELTGAKATDVNLGSEEITFVPGLLKRTRLEHDLETAASATLVAHCIILATIASGKRVQLTLRGGTDVAWSPPAAHLANVLAPLLAPLAKITARVQRRGYYPKGQGLLELTIDSALEAGAELPALRYVDGGELLAIKGESAASRELEPAHVAERQRDAARAALRTMGVPIDIQAGYAESSSPGSSITLWAKRERSTLGASALGEKGVASETIGARAGRELQRLLDAGAAIDEHAADQLVPFLGLCSGEARTGAITPHARSNMHVTALFLPCTFDIDEKEGLVRCSSGKRA